jgi:predicted RNA-binding protein
MKDTVYGAVDTARPYVDRIARDEELHAHVKNAYASARSIYDELLGNRGAQALATRVATDKDMQTELKKAVEELRRAGERVQGKSSHTFRNTTLLITGITLGILFNPATGPQTRKWLKDKLLGPEQPFEYRSNES